VASKNLIGAADLARRLKEYEGKLEVSVLRSSVRAAMAPALAAARQLIPVSPPGTKHKTYKGRPVQSGFARDNITIVTKARGDKQAVSAAMGVKKEAFYAVQFVERGTRFMAAEHWLIPAMENNRDAMEQALVAKLRDRISKLPP
jgi:HK97 gp10 family phage protein